MRTEPSFCSLPALGLDGRVVGQFLMQPLEELLARDLGGELRSGRSRDLVLRIEPRARRAAPRRDTAQEVLDAVAGQRRDHEGALERRGLG